MIKTENTSGKAELYPVTPLTGFHSGYCCSALYLQISWSKFNGKKNQRIGKTYESFPGIAEENRLNSRGKLYYRPQATRHTNYLSPIQRCVRAPE
ncbi:MAG: hypothetical protein ABL925_09475 [Methylococcales bacterium]